MKTIAPFLIAATAASLLLPACKTTRASSDDSTTLPKEGEYQEAPNQPGAKYSQNIWSSDPEEKQPAAAPDRSDPLAAVDDALAKGKQAAGKQLTREVVVAATAAEVWKAWTTLEGIKTFFAPDAKIDLKPGGAYEMYFDTQAPAGTQGGEGCTFVAIEPEKRLVFTWNFPPSLPAIRNDHTQVEIRLSAVEGGKATQVSLLQTGWKEGPDWDKGYAYFERAWSLVLSRLETRFKTGPIDWTKE